MTYCLYSVAPYLSIMDIFNKFKQLFSTPSFQRDDDDSSYRCIRCGAGHDREYETCPACGAPFVAKNEDE
jgi:ribosomal protein L37E